MLDDENRKIIFLLKGKVEKKNHFNKRKKKKSKE